MKLKTIEVEYEMECPITHRGENYETLFRFKYNHRTKEVIFSFQDEIKIRKAGTTEFCSIEDMDFIREINFDESDSNMIYNKVKHLVYGQVLCIEKGKQPESISETVKSEKKDLKQYLIVGYGEEFRKEVSRQIEENGQVSNYSEVFSKVSTLPFGSLSKTYQDDFKSRVNVFANNLMSYSHENEGFNSITDFFYQTATLKK